MIKYDSGVLAFIENHYDSFKNRKRLREKSKMSQNASVIPTKKAKIESSNYIKKCSKRFNFLRKKWKKLRNMNNNRGSFMRAISSDLMTASSSFNSCHSTSLSYLSSHSYTYSSYSSDFDRLRNKSNNRKNSSLGPNSYNNNSCYPLVNHYYNSHGLINNQPRQRPKSPRVKEEFITSYTSPRFSQLLPRRNARSRSRRLSQQRADSFERASARNTRHISQARQNIYDSELFFSLRRGISALKNLTQKAQMLGNNKAGLYGDVEMQTVQNASKRPSLLSKAITSDNPGTQSETSKKTKKFPKSKTGKTKKKKGSLVIASVSSKSNKAKPKKKASLTSENKKTSLTERRRSSSITKITKKKSKKNKKSKVAEDPKATETQTNQPEPCGCMPWCCVCPEPQMMVEENFVCLDSACNDDIFNQQPQMQNYGGFREDNLSMRNSGNPRRRRSNANARNSRQNNGQGFGSMSQNSPSNLQNGSNMAYDNDECCNCMEMCPCFTEEVSTPVQQQPYNALNLCLNFGDKKKTDSSDFNSGNTTDTTRRSNQRSNRRRSRRSRRSRSLRKIPVRRRPSKERRSEYDDETDTFDGRRTEEGTINFQNYAKTFGQESIFKEKDLMEKLCNNKENFLKEKLLSLEDVIKMIFTGGLNLKDELMKMMNTTVEKKPQNDTQPPPQQVPVDPCPNTSSLSNPVIVNHPQNNDQSKDTEVMGKIVEENMCPPLPTEMSSIYSEISSDDDIIIPQVRSKLRSKSNNEFVRKRVAKEILAEKINELSQKNRSLSQKIRESLERNQYLLDENSKYGLTNSALLNALNPLSSSECDLSHYISSRNRNLSAEVSQRLKDITLLHQLTDTTSQEQLSPPPPKRPSILKPSKPEAVQIHYVILDDKNGKMHEKSLNSASLKKIASLLNIKNAKKIDHFISEPRVNSIENKRRCEREYNFSNGCSKVHHTPNNIFVHQLQTPLKDCISNITSNSETSLKKPYEDLRRSSSHFVLEEASFASEIMCGPETNNTKQFDINYPSQNPSYNLHDSCNYLPENQSCKGSESSGTKCYLNVFPKTKLISNKSQLTRTINKMKQNKKLRDKDRYIDVDKNKQLLENRKKTLKDLRKNIFTTIKQLMIRYFEENERNTKGIESPKYSLNSKPKELDSKFKQELLKRIHDLKIEKYKKLNKIRKKDKNREVENDEDNEEKIEKFDFSTRSNSSQDYKDSKNSLTVKHNTNTNKDENLFNKDEKLISKVKSIVQEILENQKKSKEGKNDYYENEKRKKSKSPEDVKNISSYRNPLHPFNKTPIIHRTFGKSPNPVKKKITETNQFDFSKLNQNTCHNYSHFEAPKSIDRACSRNTKTTNSMITERLKRFDKRKFIENCSEDLDDSYISFEIRSISRESSDNSLHIGGRKAQGSDYCPASSLYSREATSIIKKRLMKNKRPTFFEPPLNYEYL